MRDLSDIPFKEGGRSWYGIDCWGLVVLYYEQYLGIQLPHFSDTYYTNNLDQTKEQITSLPLHEYFETHDKGQVNDIVMVKVANRPIHVGVMIDKKHMMHCSKQSGVCVENITTVKWTNRIQQYYRWKL